MLSTFMIRTTALRHHPGWLRILFASIWLFTFSSNASATPSHDTYIIHATLDVSSGRLYGTNTCVVQKTTIDASQPLPIVAYPNHFRTEHLALPHEFYDRVFPEAVSPGAMTLREVYINQQKASVTPMTDRDLPSGVFFSTTMPSSQPTEGENVALSIDFDVKIPQRFGTFGQHRSTVCLNGGWYPYLPARKNKEWRLDAPPPKAHFQLQLTVNQSGHVFINGQHYRLDKNEKLDVELEARYLSLAWMPNVHVYRETFKDKTLTYVTPRPRRKASPFLLEAASMALEHLKATRQDLPSENVLFLEVPLRRDLAIPAQGMILVSDRFMEVFTPLRDYHSGPLVEALYTTLLQDKLPVSDPHTFNWEVEAVAWLQAQIFWQNYRQRAQTLATYLRPFRFIPSVDAILQAPRFPFVGAFFGDFYETDPLREDILRFNRNETHGRILAEKLRDVSGTPTINMVADEALMGTKPFLSLIERQHGDSLHDVLRQWSTPYPEVNYSLDRWKQKRQDDGTYLSKVRIQQQGAPLEEPVTIELKRRFGGTYRGYWDGTGTHGLVTIETPRRTHRLQIDPDQRLKETTRIDNRYPPSVRLLLNSLRLRIDLNNRDHEIRAGGSILFRNDYRHRYRFDVFSAQERRGISLLHVQAFGQAFSAIDFKHYLFYGLVYADLDPGFASSESGFINQTGTVNEVSLRYEMHTQEMGRNPLDGATFYVAGELGHNEMGGDFRFWKTSMGVQGILPVKRDRHLLALRTRLSLSDRQNTPTQLLFDIGGFEGIRGINRGRLLGNTEWFGSCEYRYIIWKEMRNRGQSLIWTRMLQTALYIDAGQVTSTFDDLNRGSPHWGVGLGLRFYTDLLGVFPSVIRFDVARQMDRPRVEDRLMYHIGLGHTF